MRSGFPLAVPGLLLALSAAAGEPTYQGFLDQVTQSPDCRMQDGTDMTVYACASTGTWWYFTKPGNPAHPSVATRVVTQTGRGAYHTSEHGWWFAGSSAAAFQVFFQQVTAQDHQNAPPNSP